MDGGGGGRGGGGGGGGGGVREGGRGEGGGRNKDQNEPPWRQQYAKLVDVNAVLGRADRVKGDIE